MCSHDQSSLPHSFLAILNAPVIDSSGEILCAAGVNSDMYCLSSNNGRESWTDFGESQIMSRPVIWETADTSVVYVIESTNGRVRQHDLFSGERYWDFSCADITGLQLCQDAVEAEFAISPSGNVIYFGDIFGRIMSLEIATFDTEAPTISPTGVSTASPTKSPSSLSDPSVTIPAGDGEQDHGDSSSIYNVDNEANGVNAQEQVTQEDSESKNTGLYIGAAIGGLCVLLVPFVVYSLMRGGKDKSGKGEEMLVEVIDDCSSEDPEDGDLTYETQEPDSDGIEIEHIGTKAIHSTSSPPRKSKRKKRRKKKGDMLPETPQTALTLESIEEGPGESLPSCTPDKDEVDDAAIVWSDDEDVEKAIEAVDLGRKFEKIADSEHSNSEDSSDGSDSSDISSGEEKTITTGNAGVANGSNHLELAVGNNTNSDLTPLQGDDEASNCDNSSPSDEEAPPPPPVVTSSSKKWSWGSLLHRAAVHSTSKSNKSPQTQDQQNIVLRPVNVDETGSKQTDKKSTGDEHSTASDATPPASNQKKIDPTENNVVKPSLNENEPSAPAKSISPTPSPQQLRSSRSDEDDEEEKKENEETASRPQTPAASSTGPTSPTGNSMLSSNDALSPHSPWTNMSEPSFGRTISPATRSSKGLSPPHSPSNSSNDDSLFTSATGMTGEKQCEPQNLSPLSTYLFDNEIGNQTQTRSDVPHDEVSEVLGKREVVSPTKSLDDHKFRYLDDDVPDDEVTTAPGFHYMTNQKEETKSAKYGQSVRSRKDPTTFTEGNQDSGTESPITSIYNQLAAMGQKQAEEKKKHSFKRRSKRNVREEANDEEPESQEEPDTWSNFLQELAEAEKQFFSPSLLKKGDSEDTEDSEVARINSAL